MLPQVFAFAAIVSYAATRGLSAGASDGVASGRGNTWEAYNDNDEDWMFVEDDEGDVLLQKEAPVGNGPSVLRRHTDKVRAIRVCDTTLFTRPRIFCSSAGFPFIARPICRPLTMRTK